MVAVKWSCPNAAKRWQTNNFHSSIVNTEGFTVLCCVNTPQSQHIWWDFKLTPSLLQCTWHPRFISHHILLLLAPSSVFLHFFPILNLERLIALLISRCKSSLWKNSAKLELSLTLLTFLSEMKIRNNWAHKELKSWSFIGVCVHWHRLHERRLWKIGNTN